MTLGNIFGLILTVVLFVVLVAITKFINKRDGMEESVPFFILGLVIFVFIWLGIFVGVTGTDAFSSKSISWAEHNISKLEQKIENSDKEYDIIRYQTKLQKWEKNKEYYFDQIKENNKKTKEQK